MAIWMLARGAGHLAIKRAHLSVEPETMWRIARLSGMGTFQVAIGSMSWIGLVRVISSYGATAIAGYTIAIRLLIFALMPAFGLGGAAATMVGQSLGAGKPERAEQAVWTAAKYDVLFLSAIGLVFLLFTLQIVGLFTPDAAGMVLEQSFNGAGDTWTPTWLNLLAFRIIQIPLAWVLAEPFGMHERGVFVSVTVAYSVLAVVSGVLFRRGGGSSSTF